ncbi:demethylmenaquinone methyltransferase/2-methoxy-6-polyprenyl-1,4-benzoquinol methylase [Lewinella marina]|uniref:Demethylmenaquinone methyltransferase n=1 Tax=Neolewinella marina TaxID=438751 RepID=A0A2G0CFL7_9BACT|nr:bifunctional demethylmenaquinone methyltransferase/2-methoxy-6-polyprenyl-1,4-benzoquinol methylase UbiE [Neolewinella marina]NJB85544.1 demethylmenaquinone methyltransferase/2-methoxy-6-polyprenyl-1,4-benzoquinol methylase [Neolewinella marina]PHK98769.1 bifunctional demethylmenaquinone methyltransferase/2-methoxy-6-polyprenyl-1,4-benzoquinol methylase UbiE [Neolewinella marina]
MSGTEKVVKPYGEGESKKEEVGRMFDAIAPTYDLLNRGTSLGVDTLWRRKMIAELDPAVHHRVLDVATGTADVAIQTVRRRGVDHVTGIDLSAGMLAYGRTKVKQAGLENHIVLEQGDSENLPYADASFDAVTAAFGVRNFENLERGLAEMHRVLRPGGKLVVLEFSRIRYAPIRWGFNLYFGKIMPLIGRLQSKDPRAYAYLFESVQAFPSGEDFLTILDRVGYNNTECQALTFGIASIYTATR